MCGDGEKAGVRQLNWDGKAFCPQSPLTTLPLKLTALGLILHTKGKVYL
jgi:hypothetical protein